MLLTCVTCAARFPDRQLILGKERHLHGRRQCLQCLPFRPRRSPSKVTSRPPATKICEACGSAFPAKAVIDGKLRSLYRRHFCLTCSPFGAHNTSKSPPGPLGGDALTAERRRRRSAKAYRYQKKKRRQLKAELVAAAGGRCVDCGYAGSIVAFDLHHHDATGKEFSISSFNGAVARLRAEAAKCVLLCASCHRIRHAAEDAMLQVDAVVRFRRAIKARAVGEMGGACQSCGRTGPNAMFDFHHLDPATKSFAISVDGIPRPWSKVLAELAKCVMLCANCHREVHAGVRTLTGGPRGLAEDALPYAA